MDVVISSITSFFTDFFGNYMLVSAMIAWFAAQVIKIFTHLFQTKKLNLRNMLFSTGGMPSSHSATVLALAVSSGLKYGFDSAVFAICAILAMVVMIDATGVRYETGKQAILLNKITKKIFSGDAEQMNAGLKELVGHTPLQVIMGALLGIVVASVMAFFML